MVCILYWPSWTCTSWCSLSRKLPADPGCLGSVVLWDSHMLVVLIWSQSVSDGNTALGYCSPDVMLQGYSCRCNQLDIALLCKQCAACPVNISYGAFSVVKQEDKPLGGVAFHLQPYDPVQWASSALWCAVSVWISWCRVVHAVPLLCQAKQETVSQPTKAWNISSTRVFSGPRTRTISWTAKNKDHTSTRTITASCKTDVQLSNKGWFLPAPIVKLQLPVSCVTQHINVVRLQVEEKCCCQLINLPSSTAIGCP